MSMARPREGDPARSTLKEQIASALRGIWRSSIRNTTLSSTWRVVRLMAAGQSTSPSEPWSLPSAAAATGLQQRMLRAACMSRPASRLSTAARARSFSTLSTWIGGQVMIVSAAEVAPSASPGDAEFLKLQKIG